MIINDTEGGYLFLGPESVAMSLRALGYTEEMIEDQIVGHMVLVEYIREQLWSLNHDLIPLIECVDSEDVRG